VLAATKGQASLHYAPRGSSLADIAKPLTKLTEEELTCSSGRRQFSIPEGVAACGTRPRITAAVWQVHRGKKCKKKVGNGDVLSQLLDAEK
jgi:hypothetical protein